MWNPANRAVSIPESGRVSGGPGGSPGAVATRVAAPLPFRLFTEAAKPSPNGFRPAAASAPVGAKLFLYSHRLQQHAARTQKPAAQYAREHREERPCAQCMDVASISDSPHGPPVNNQPRHLSPAFFRRLRQRLAIRLQVLQLATVGISVMFGYAPIRPHSKFGVLPPGYRYRSVM